MRRIFYSPWLLYACVSSLTAISLVFLFAIANQDLSLKWDDILHSAAASKMRSQCVWALISIVACLLVYYVVNQSLLSFLAYPLYAFNILLLIFTLIVADDVRGSGSWINLGGINFQPAELSKVIVAITLAEFCSAKRFINNTKSQLIILSLIALPAILIIAQKEVGQVLIYLSLFIALYMQGISIRYLYIFLANAVAAYLIFVMDMVYVDTLFIIAVVFILLYHFIYRIKIKNRILYYLRLSLIIVGAFAVYHIFIPFVVNNFMRPHHVRRIVSIVDAKQKERDWMNEKTHLVIKNSDFKAIKYNVRQAEIAIGSGGFWGKGIGKSTQMRLSFIPEQHTDFIFSAIAEGWGVFGCILVLFIYFILLLHLLFLARKQRSAFGSFLIYAFWGYIFFYAMINIGMVIGIFPVVGVPLPWVSYGGSSFVTNSIMMAIVFKFSLKKYIIER